LATYGVAEITQSEGLTDVELHGKVNLDDLREELIEIRDAINPIITEVPADGALSLQRLVLFLTVSRQGRILFLMSGSVEASITLTFPAPKAPLTAPDRYGIICKESGAPGTQAPGSFISGSIVMTNAVAVVCC
jgi:hypothetical protein